MRRRLARVMALALIAVVLGPAAPARADVVVSGEFCVSDNYFYFDILLTGVQQDDVSYSEPAIVHSLHMFADSNVTDSQFLSFGFTYQVLDLTMPDVFLYTNPFFTVGEVGTAPQRWVLGAATEPDALAVHQGDGIWNITFEGRIANGTDPFDAGVDPLFRIQHQNRGVFTGATFAQLNGAPIAACDDPEPPVTTTQPPVTTTQPPVTTTEPPVTTTQPPVTTTEPPVTTTQPPVTTTQPPATTTSQPQATTTTVDVSPSSTLPETGVGDAFRVSLPGGVILLLLGVAALGGAAGLGRIRRQE